MPIEPIESYLARKQGKAPVRPFSSPVAGPVAPGGEDPGVFAGFVGSTLSSIPELFGAKPTELAEQYRTNNPIGGFISEMAGFAVPYLGAERIAQLPSMAPRVASGVERLLGHIGKTTAENPVYAGVARELLVNAPVEASRLAVGTVAFPENDDLWGDVGLTYALTGGIGGLGGFFRAGGKVLAKAGQVEGADIFLAPTHQMKLVLDEGAAVKNVPAEEFIPQLRQQVLTETPGKAGASGKELDYVLPLEGMSREESKGISSLFVPGAKVSEETGKVTGLVKQLLTEGRGSKTLKAGEQQVVLDMLPETFQSIDDVAKEVQFPRKLTVADKDGVRTFASLVSKPGWRKINDRLSLAQERDGGFIVAYQLSEGTGQARGKGAGRTKVGSQYLIGKTLNPGVFDPKAKKLAQMVEARWAKWGAAFGPTRFDDVFNEQADLMMKAMSVVDYHNLRKLPEAEWKKAFKEKLGQTLAKEEGLLDKKLGFKDSQQLRDWADFAYTTFKPTEFLQRQNPVYGRFFGLMRSAVRTADEYTTRIMRGKSVVPDGVSQAAAMRSKGVKYVSGFKGHRPVNQILDDMSDQEVNLMAHLSGTDRLSNEGLAELVKEGSLTTKAANAIKELRAINEDVISSLVMPVFKETGKDVAWLENHLGVPRISRGDLFYVVKDAAGQPKHLAFGKNGSQAMREAKIVQETAKEAGHDWSIETAKPRHLAGESEDALADLSKEIFTNIQKTSEEGELIYRAMRRLSTIKATSGRNPSIPVSSGMFNTRTSVQTSYALQTFSKKDVLNAMEGHMKQLLHFAGMQSWKERFGSVAAQLLQQQDPKLYSDLMRKGNQMLGFEGKITNQLNDILRPVLGSTLGAKPATKIASAVNSTLAGFNIFWLNPTFAVLNLLTPLQTVAPWIAHMRVASEADLGRTMFMQLTPTVGADGLPNGVSAFTDPLKILGQSVKLMRDTPADLRDLMGQALDDGVFHPQLFEEWIGRQTAAQQTLRGAWKEDGIAGFLKKGVPFMAERSEQFSRLTAFNSGYIVGKEYFGLEGDALYRFARRAVEVTQYNYSTIDRSKIFTGPVGSILGLFKNWQLHFLGNMIGYAGLAMKGESFAPLMWTGGSALALGGLGATPLLMAADGLAKWQDKDSNGFLWTQQNFGEQAGDALYFGLPAFLGVSLQASASIPGTDVRNETSSMFSFVLWERMKRLGKALGDMNTDYWSTGEAFANPNTRDELWNAIMPRFMTKMISTVEGDYVRSMSTGMPQVRNISPFAKMAVAAGFNPIEVEQWQVASRLMYKDQEQRKSVVEGLGKAYANAVLNKDGEEAQRVVQRAIAAGELDSVMKSGASRMVREQNNDILSRYDKQQQSIYRQALAPR